MDLQLKDKTALITGSNRGTGEVIAKALAAEGVEVILHSDIEGASAETAKRLPGSHALWADLSCADGAQQLLAQLQERELRVDILVNNYGSASRGRWGKCQHTDWIDMYQKNVLSAVTLIEGLTGPMKAQSWGRIIQLGTIGSHQPGSRMPHYYAAKGALATMGVSLSQDLSHTGITVNTVSPGYIRTPELEAGFRLKAAKKGWGDDWQEIEKHIVAEEFPNPCGRIAEREEVADLVSFLCSERAAFINGQNIRIDGGAIAYV